MKNGFMSPKNGTKSKSSVRGAPRWLASCAAIKYPAAFSRSSAATLACPSLSVCRTACSCSRSPFSNSGVIFSIGTCFSTAASNTPYSE